jgi:uncharacterized membrane protein HdeD (DUF308 family)
MTELANSSTDRAASSQPTKRRNRWMWFLGLGALLLVLGMAGVGVTTLLEFTTFLVFVPMLLASSILQLLTCFFAEEGKEALLHFFAAGVELALGIFLMAHPFQRVVGPIAVIAVFLIVSGLVRLARSLMIKSRGRGWVVISGIVTLLLGIFVWIEWPISKLWFVGLCIALDFICRGTAWSVLALAERKPLQEPVS